MKARVIETGEIVNVTPNPTWYKENGQGPDRREWDEDELEFLNSTKKMISIDEAVEWLRDNTMAELNLDLGNSQLVREFVDHFKEAMVE